MAGVDIQARVKAGLANARAKTGGDGLGLVELRVLTGGNNNPLYPVEPSESWVELVDCLFSTVDKNTVDGTLVKNGDIEFVATSDVVIKQNDVMRRAGVEYIVKTIDATNPTGVLLVQMGTARIA